MADYVKGFTGLNATNSRINGLMADFSGLLNLEKHVDEVLNRLAYSECTQSRVGMVKGGTMSRAEFDGWFSELVRVELGKTLAIIRAKAKQKAATEARAGSAASGVLWHQAKTGNRGYVGINQPRGKISSRSRVVPEPHGGESGIRRHRTVSDRTRQINEYFGPDRHFVLRFLEFGTDVRTANPSGPKGRGSKATYGKRGSIKPRSFMHTVASDMELAAQQLGETLIGRVENFVDKQFKEE